MNLSYPPSPSFLPTPPSPHIFRTYKNGRHRSLRLNHCASSSRSRASFNISNAMGSKEKHFTTRMASQRQDVAGGLGGSKESWKLNEKHGFSRNLLQKNGCTGKIVCFEANWESYIRWYHCTYTNELRELFLMMALNWEKQWWYERNETHHVFCYIACSMFMFQDWKNSNNLLLSQMFMKQ